MSDEFFYGITLKGEKAVVTWDPQKEEEIEDQPDRANKLIIKQTLLGAEAKADELNVVEVETAGKEGKIKIPIAVLKVGENRFSQSFLEFPDAPVTFRLTQGSGPVHIHGQHLCGEFDPMEEFEEEGLAEEDDDSDNEIRAEESDEPKPKKQKVSKAAKNDKNSKK